MNKIEEIQKLKSLLDQGAITLDEFNILKQNVLEDGTLAMKQNYEIPAHKEASTQQAIKGDINESQPKKKFKAIIAWVIIGFLVVMYYVGSQDSVSYNSSSSSGSSGENSSKHCRYCGKEYSGAGYYHFMDGCESSTEYDDMCTQKCCYESWNATHKK